MGVKSASWFDLLNVPLWCLIATWASSNNHGDPPLSPNVAVELKSILASLIEACVAPHAPHAPVIEIFSESNITNVSDNHRHADN